MNSKISQLQKKKKLYTNISLIGLAVMFLAVLVRVGTDYGGIFLLLWGIGVVIVTIGFFGREAAEDRIKLLEIYDPASPE